MSDRSQRATAASAILVAGYLGLVRLRRYANLRDLERQYPHLVADPSKMTYPEATAIQRVTSMHESPMLSKLALELALFQTCKLPRRIGSPLLRLTRFFFVDAIPTISSLLLHTKRLTCPAAYGKRAEDTGVLLLETQVHGLDSERGSQALCRINWQHDRYGVKISRDDKLFTLCLFIYEPLRLIDEHDWRKTTPLEKQARFVFWREMGARMGITDIPKTSEELQAWRRDYQKEKMVYAESNAIVGDATIALFLRPYPRFMHAFMRQALIVLVPEPAREAFGWPRSRPRFLYALIPALLALRAFIVRRFRLPRSRSDPGDFGLSDPKNTRVGADGVTRYLRTNWFFEPLYCSPTFFNRLWRFLGYQVPDGKRFQPEGYALPACGPSDLEKRGSEEVKANAEKMRLAAKNGACPFAPQ